jgi:DNA-directed RNA polymerase subunit RPC12/RpoP
MPEPRTPEVFLGARVDELDGHWLEIECACGIRVFYPFKLLAKTCGAKRVDEVQGRLRCKHCGARPGRVAVTNNPTRGLQYEDVWAVPLVG